MCCQAIHHQPVQIRKRRLPSVNCHARSKERLLSLVLPCKQASRQTETPCDHFLPDRYKLLSFFDDRWAGIYLKILLTTKICVTAELNFTKLPGPKRILEM